MCVSKNIINQFESSIKEFEEKEGTITIEFSIKKSNLKTYFEELNKMHCKIGNWFATTCDSCIKNHGKGYVHLELIQDKWDNHISKASNLLARTNYKRSYLEI